MSSSSNNDQQNWAEGSGSVLLSGVKENNFISELEADFSRIETVFDTLLAQPLSEIASRFPPTERARLYLLYAYCCNKLTSLYLEANGEPEAKEVLEQEKRVQESYNRVENTINPPQPSMMIDRSAAARFIMHSLPKEPKERETREEVRVTSSTHTRFDDYSERRFSGGSSPNDKRASGFYSSGSSPSDRRSSGGFYNTSSPSSDRRSSNNYNIGSPYSERDSFRISTSSTSSRITHYDRSESYIRDYDRDYDRNHDRGYYDRDYNRDDRDRDRGDEPYLITGMIMISFGSSFLMTFGRNIRSVVLSKPSLIGGITIGIIRILIFFVGIIGFFAPFKRCHNWLMAQSICIVMTTIALLILGAMIWFKTLNERNFFKDVWIGWMNGTRARFQDQFNCCGWEYPLSYGVVSRGCLDLQQVNTTMFGGCDSLIIGTGDKISREVFTLLFGFIAIDIITFLTISVLIHARNIVERFRKIEEKNLMLLL
ncbi:1726_t:CDS:2 [Dentiscutata heterogama]|uniref:1726_t:CDS:1 n=1 Tax=Dentiscutata heterogama TaxID=1316150 RepID=A0ACA9LTR4_9GLOM|nr:1726_t:CDS:2 [Dentiscutata heterogama]